MLKQPQITFIFDRYKKATLTRKATVEIRITHNYKQRYISTGVMLYANQWKKGKIINSPDILQISRTLDKMVSDVREIVLDMMNKGEIDISLIKTELAKRQKGSGTFIEFCERRADIRKYKKSRDSQERYDRFLRLFKDWGEIISFEDINETSIIAYDKYLLKQGMKPYSKWNNYHRFLNGFITDAIDEGLLSKNPYKWVNIDRCKDSHGISKYLEPCEFKRLMNAKMPTESIERVRDLFVFQTYTCMSYSDLRDFDFRKITEIKGMKVYMGHRKKTNKPFTIPLLKPAIDILEKYNISLPIISNVKYNEYLKIVAQASGIDKPISTHWARHTGATLLLNDGIDMRIVSRICGHSSTRITEQIYAKLLDETVVSAIRTKEKLLQVPDKEE